MLIKYNEIIEKSSKGSSTKDDNYRSLRKWIFYKMSEKEAKYRKKACIYSA